MRAWVLVVALVACKKDRGEDDSGTAPTTTPPLTASFDPARRWAATDDWEPEVAADPLEPWVYQSTTRIGSVKADLVVRASADGGETWGGDQVVSDGRDAYDPQLEVAAETGCVFFTSLGGKSGWDTALRSSCDHGATWTDGVLVAPGFTTDHGWLVVSPDGADVYVAFNGAERSTGRDGEGWVAVSHDGGASFEDVFVVGDGLTAYWFEFSAAIAPNGTVYVANVVYSEDYHGPADIVLWRSADGGATWQTHTLATSQEPADCAWADGCTYGFFAAQSALAVDAAGTLLVVWAGNDAPGAPNRLWTATSPGGDAWETFGPPVPLTDGVGEANFPAVAAAPGLGDFRVMWQESLGPADPATFATRYQRTVDSGVTWLAAPADLSDGRHPFPYGDYGGLAVDGDGVAHVIWGEGASWTGPGATWYTRGE